MVDSIVDDSVVDDSIVEGNVVEDRIAEDNADDDIADKENVRIKTCLALGSSTPIKLFCIKSSLNCCFFRGMGLDDYFERITWSPVSISIITSSLKPKLMA